MKRSRRVSTLWITLLTVTGVFGSNQLSTVRRLPWWAWTHGLLSAVAAIRSMIALKPLGAGRSLAPGLATVRRIDGEW